MSLQKYLYTGHTVNDVLNRYIDELRSSGKISDSIHANMLSLYQNMIKDKRFLRDSRKLFNEVYNLIEKKHPGLNFSIAGRRKSLISVEKKIQRYFSLGKSPDLIRDYFAFRIILFGDDSINLTKHCYMVMEEIIEYAIGRKFTPCERLPLIDVTDVKEHKNPFFSAFKYKQYIKDYICFPKRNGYKSLHLVLQDINGRHLEIQIRTLQMHAEIESSEEANHDEYKLRNNVDFPVMRDKISIDGYTYINGQVFDFVGIEDSLTIFQRQKTF